MPTTGYPAARYRASVPRPAVIEQFDRFEALGAEVTAGDANSTLYTFSGIPDLIVLHARSNGALFTLTDRTGQEQDEVIVHGDETRAVRLRRDVVLVRNLGAGANAAVYVEGFYAKSKWLRPGTEDAELGAPVEGQADARELPAPPESEAPARRSSPCTLGFR